MHTWACAAFRTSQEASKFHQLVLVWWFCKTATKELSPCATLPSPLLTAKQHQGPGAAVLQPGCQGWKPFWELTGDQLLVKVMIRSSLSHVRRTSFNSGTTLNGHRAMVTLGTSCYWSNGHKADHTGLPQVQCFRDEHRSDQRDPGTPKKLRVTLSHLIPATGPVFSDSIQSLKMTPLPVPSPLIPQQLNFVICAVEGTQAWMIV